MTMAKFVFRLAKVARVKKIKEDIAKLEWAKANSAYHQAVQQLERLQREKTEALAFGSQQLDIKFRHTLYPYLTKLDRLIKSQEETVAQAKAAAEHALQVWLQARRENEIMEHLEAKQYEDFVLEQLQMEQKQLDDSRNQCEQI